MHPVIWKDDFLYTTVTEGPGVNASVLLKQDPHCQTVQQQGPTSECYWCYTEPFVVQLALGGESRSLYCISESRTAVQTSGHWDVVQSTSDG